MLDRDDFRPRRTTAVLVTLSAPELEVLERLMVRRGVRQRSRVLLWSMLIVAGATELAARVLPAAARARALDRRRVRVVYDD